MVLVFTLLTFIALFLFIAKHIGSVVFADKLEQAKRFYTAIGWLICILFSVVSIVILSFVLNFSPYWGYSISNSIEHWGQMGDFFGGMLNPILAFASFVAVLYTIQIQSKELQLAREELRLTRSELAASAEANKKISESAEQQLQIHKRQNAESTFYKCLDRLKEDIKLVHDSKFRVSLEKRWRVHWHEHQPVDLDFTTDYRGFCVVMFNRINQPINLDGKIYSYGRSAPLKDDFEIFRVREDATSMYFMDAVAANYSAFEQFINSMNHTIYWLQEILKCSDEYYMKEYFRYYIIKCLDEEMLVLLALILGRNAYIPISTIVEIDLFRNLNVDIDGYLPGKKVNVTELKLIQEALKKFYPADHQNCY